MRYAEIMAGGSGTRLWPMSVQDQPKQLIPFIHGQSLLEVAANRLDGLVDADKRYICTGESWRAPIRKNLPSYPDELILGEPVGRNTLNAVGFAAVVALKNDPDAIIAVFTADHLIEPVDIFQDRVNEAFSLAEKHPEKLVTFGITPTFPATGYGYVHVGNAIKGFDNARKAKEFKEKPKEERAEEYLKSGDYLWNSGMFVWRAQTLMDNIKQYAPDAYEGLMEISDAWGTDNQQAVLDEVYPTLPKQPVDIAIMEPAAAAGDVATVPMPVKWLDVGNWNSYAEICDTDDNNNATSGGKTALLDTSETLIVSNEDDHLIATIGLDNIMIIHTPNATLVCRKEDGEKIKALYQHVADTFGDDYL